MGNTTDTDHGPLYSEHKRRQIFRFDPTVSTGTLLQLVTIIGAAFLAYGTYQQDRATTKLELDTVKASAAAEKTATKESLGEIRADVKEVQRTLNQLGQTLAVIEARQQPQKEKP